MSLHGFLRKHLSFLLALTAFFITLLVLGCGGNNSAPPVATAATAWEAAQVGATFVGRAECRDCHARIDDEYATQVNAHTKPNSRHGQAASLQTCGSCHTTGFGQPSGGKLDGTTPKLDGIGCESCHGPGSKHIAADTKLERKATITRTPPAQETCWQCHGDRRPVGGGVYHPGAMTQPAAPVTAASLRETAPGSLRGPHYASAAFLAGRSGYGLTTPISSPHSKLPDSCLDCHKPGISSATGKVNHGATALSVNLDTTQPNCAKCHSGDTRSALMQDGVNKLMIELGGEDPANPGHFDSNNRGGLLTAYSTAHAINLSTNADPDNPHVIAYKAARYNFRYVYGDHSLGVHNPAFTRRLLEDAKKILSDNP
jgi:formate-dependent nitrite reductase cytochrome c552 subunit